MEAHDPEIARVADAVRQYVRGRPNAADSLRGVAEYWLAPLSPPPSFDTVRAALALLEQEGAMARAVLGDEDIWRAVRS
jgi:hypothetical protein